MGRCGELESRYEGEQAGRPEKEAEISAEEGAKGLRKKVRIEKMFCQCPAAQA